MFNPLMEKRSPRKSGNKYPQTKMHIDPVVKALLQIAANGATDGVLSRFILEAAKEMARKDLRMTDSDWSDVIREAKASLKTDVQCSLPVARDVVEAVKADLRAQELKRQKKRQAAKKAK